MPTSEREAKREIRRHVIAIRQSLADAHLATTADLLADHAAALVADRGTPTVSAYVSADGEPGTTALLDRLNATGTKVLLPLLCDDFDLEWAEYRPGALREGRFGILQPTGSSLGKEAVREAGVVFCPGVAGTVRGERLGRGGGSYDRALARTDPEATRCLLLYDDEVLESVPVEPHDALVDYLCTPSRLIQASPGRFEHQGRVSR